MEDGGGGGRVPATDPANGIKTIEHVPPSALKDPVNPAYPVGIFCLHVYSPLSHPPSRPPPPRSCWNSLFRETRRIISRNLILQEVANDVKTLDSTREFGFSIKLWISNRDGVLFKKKSKVSRT